MDVFFKEPWMPKKITFIFETQSQVTFLYKVLLTIWFKAALQ